MLDYIKELRYHLKYLTNLTTDSDYSVEADYARVEVCVDAIQELLDEMEELLDEMEETSEDGE